MMNGCNGPDGEAHSWLRRLTPGFYRGYASVHWQMTIDRRRKGWLSSEFHGEFREILLHALTRYRLVCPVYCLMPDHMHLLWMGISTESDQRNACSFFRRYLNALLRHNGPEFRLQSQAYDHVLREDERKVDPVRELASYILENPHRAKLVQGEEAWPYVGCMVPGYPQMHPLDGDFWAKFWRIRSSLVERDRREVEGDAG